MQTPVSETNQITKYTFSTSFPIHSSTSIHTISQVNSNENVEKFYL